MSCSIHLGNYILVVQPPTPRKESKPGDQKPPAKPVSTKEITQQAMGALDFQLAWLRFLRDTEEEYQKRLTRNEKKQPLSVFEVNVDIFELYLLKVSGRALASTQHLNLNITSAMGSHLKIFDTQQPEAPSEFEQDLEAEMEIETRQAKREKRRRKRRRITAEFLPQTTLQQLQDNQAEQEEMNVPEFDLDTEEEAPIKYQQHDSLNERDDVGGGHHSADSMNDNDMHDNFDDVNDRSQTISVPASPDKMQIFHQENDFDHLRPVEEEVKQDYQVFEEPSHYSQEKSFEEKPQQQQFRASQLYPESIIQTDEGDKYYHDPNIPENHPLNTSGGKIMIGDQSIDDNFGEDAHHNPLGSTLGNEPIIQNYNEEEDLMINEDEINGNNPFMHKSVSFIQQRNSIVSQGSIPNNITLFEAPTTIDAVPEINKEIEEMQSPSMPQIEPGTKSDVDPMKNTFEQIVINEIPKPLEIVPPEEEVLPRQQTTIVQEVVMEQSIKEQHIDLLPIEEPPIVITSSARATDIPAIEEEKGFVEPQTPIVPENTLAIVQEDLSTQRPLTAVASKVDPVIHSEHEIVLKPVEKPELVEVELQTSFEQAPPPRPESPPETEVIMRFEVAVGTTPTNMSLVESHHGQDVGCGMTPVNQSLQRDHEEIEYIDNLQVSPDFQEQFQTADLSEPPIQLESSIDRRESTSSPDRQNVSVEGESHKYGSRLEVTLTAEPDKPIMVEVRGGEKQFLISALTKHIYDILSQPHRLQMGREDSVQDSQEGQDQDEEEPEEVLPQNVKPIKLGKNINLKLKSLKKNLQRNSTNLPQVQKVQQKQQMFDTATRNEMHENLPPLSVSNNAITIEELDQTASKFEDEMLILPSKSPRQQQVNHRVSYQPLPDINRQQSLHNNDQEHYMKSSTQQFKGVSSRTSSGIALSPLTTSIVEETKQERSTVKKPQLISNNKRTERDKVYIRQFDSMSKRTTEEAYADAKIREEVRITQIFDSETVLSMRGGRVSVGGPAVEGSLRKTVVSNNSQRRETMGVQSQISIGQKRESRVSNQNQQPVIVSEEIVEPQIQTKSRPETATFNQQQEPMRLSLVPSQSELPPINMKSSQLSNRLLDLQVHPRTPKYQQQLSSQNAQTTASGGEEEIIYTEKNNRHSRKGAATPEATSPIIGDDHQHFTGLNAEFINSTPAEIEQFSLPPLQPTIPMPHPNGYFQADGPDYMMMRQDSQSNFLNTSELHNTQDRYSDDQPHPQANYFDPYQGQQQMPDGAYYQYAPDQLPEGVYPEQDQNTPDYILAEGYLLHYKETMPIRQPAEVIADRQVYDLSRNPPPSHIQQQQQQQKHQQYNTQQNSRIAKGQNTQGMLQRHPTFQEQRNNNVGGYIQYPPQKKKGANTTNNSKLPIVQTKKRLVVNSQNNTIYSMNGGPAFRTMPYTPARSQSPLRRKNNVFYTSNFSATHQPQLMGQQPNQMMIPPQYEEIAYYSQSPQGGSRMRNSPYLSDDEYKILHDFYDIQCEPTGLNRGGVPLMRVKRINRPNKRTFNIFNFTEETNQNVSLPKALSSLQIYYPQYQPTSPFKQDYLMSRTLASPSKWFDRFYQSTRNLNQTITNLHKQHSRKLRSYSVSSLSSANEGVIGNGMQGVRMSQTDYNNQHPLFTKQQHMRDNLEGISHHNREHVSLPSDTRYPHNSSVSQEMATTSSTHNSRLKKVNSSTKGGPQGAVFMPPLNKIYNGHGDNNLQNHHHHLPISTTPNGNNMGKKNKLPPRPQHSSKTQLNGKQSSAAVAGGAAPALVNAAT